MTLAKDIKYHDFDNTYRVEYNTSQQTVRRNARAAIASMRRQSELNGNSGMSLQDINNEIQQARQTRKPAAQ